MSEVTSAGGFFYLVPLVVFFPVIGLLINVILHGRLGEKLVGAIASLAVILSFIVSVLLAISLSGHPEGATVPFLEWISLGDLQIPWSFRVDTLSVTMMLVVSGVGALIHIYAIGYMHEDVRHHHHPERFPRFFIYLNLFIALMMILVSASNYVMLFVGWEGVGLCSYLLIGFWYERGNGGIGNAIAAKKAMVVNRIGDVGFLLAAWLMFHTFRSLEFSTIFQKAPGVAQTAPGVILGITLLLLVGVTGKSAQIPLFVWLPDAMAGPTPVSALIHAATMVTAGVYLVARSNVLYSLVPQAQAIVALVGGVTALFAATIAVGQFDIKKVLAYSTISQLGFMVAAVGMGAFAAGMFHLVTHAFFKALLFLSAGSVIQGMEHGEHEVGEHHPKALKEGVHAPPERPGEYAEFDPQDMRNMGGLRSRMKITFWVYLVGALALSGIVPFAGFWSKDEIVSEASILQPVVFFLLVIAAFFTAFYMGRQVVMVFFGQPRTEVAANARENPPVMTVPLIILAVLATIGGALNLPGIHSFTSWLEHTISSIHPAEFNWGVFGLTTFLALLAIAAAWYTYTTRAARLQALPAAKRPDDPLRSILGPIFVGMEKKWWIDEIYSAVITRPYARFAKFLNAGETESADPTLVRDWVHDTVFTGGYKLVANFFAMVIDLGIVDALVNVVADGIRLVSARLRRIQSGYVSNYALGVFLGVVVILGFLILRASAY